MAELIGFFDVISSAVEGTYGAIFSNYFILFYHLT
jgi:hypothetical protein